MMENYRRSMTMDLGIELVNLNKTIETQKIMIDELELKAAMYKANFFGKHRLADKLTKQIHENMDSCIGEFDGFCFASWRGNAVYRSIDDMWREGLITEDERSFCEV